MGRFPRRVLATPGMTGSCAAAQSGPRVTALDVESLGFGMGADCHGAGQNGILAPFKVGVGVSRQVRAPVGIDQHHWPSIGCSAASGEAVRLVLDGCSGQGASGQVSDRFRRYASLGTRSSATESVIPKR